MAKYEVTLMADTRQQKATEKRAAKDCKHIARGEYEGEFGPAHVLLGLNKPGKKGDKLTIEGRIFEIPQDALWERAASAV